MILKFRTRVTVRKVVTLAEMGRLGGEAGLGKMRSECDLCPGLVRLK